MTRDALKAAVQPHLEQDFDALYDEFVEESGDGDVVAFLAHLASFELIPPAVAREIANRADAPSTPPKAAAPPVPPPEFDDFDDDAHTVVSTDREADEAKIAAQAAAKAPPKAPPKPPPPPPSLRNTATPFPAPRGRNDTPEGAMPAGGALAQEAPPAAGDNRAPATGPRPLSPMATLPEDLGPPDDFDDEEGPRTRRTMFRRQSDGGLRVQTDVVDVEIREKRARRRKPPEADGLPPVGEEGRYQFLGSVGEGAMGKIHLASDGRLHRKVAFKAMSAEIAENPQLAVKFAAEARITAQLDHPNIVPVYNLETPSSYTMKLIKGVTVDDIIRDTKERLENGTPLHEVNTLNGRLELFIRACDALHYAHSRGVVHRDLKPENIMVGEFNELYVMDWGIARLMNGDFPDKVDLGSDVPDEGDLVIGTPGYMSPEQAEGLNAELDGRSDQYSLGLILYELVALQPAVSGKSPLKIVMRHQDGEKDPMVHALGHKIAPELRAIVDKATQKDKSRRYPHEKALADDIKAYLRGDPVSARPEGPLLKALRWMGKHRQATAFAAFTMFAFLGFVTLSVIAYSQIALVRAEAREQQRSNLMAQAAAQSSLIDGQFTKYEGLLSLVATHAEDSLGRPPLGTDHEYLASEFDEDKGPPDTMASKRYGRPVSLTNSAFVLAPGVSQSAVRGAMSQLHAVDRHFYKVLLRSHSEGAGTYTPKRAQRALAEVGVPILRAYVGLENGLLQSYPGHGKWPQDFDPRTSAWYKLAQAKRGPNWGAPSVDLHGQGLILTCAQAMYDSQDTLLGVAGVDVTFDFIITDLLELPGFENAPEAEAFLLDPEGKIVVRSSRKGAEFDEGRDGRALQMRAFGNEDVVKAVKERRSGYEQANGANGHEIILYNRMNSIGWYYVIAGPEDELFAITQ